MTGRQLIKHIADTAWDLDFDFPIFILYRDSEGCVEFKDRVKHYQVINGKIYVENDFERLTN